MKSTPVVLHLREYAPVFGGRVAGALEFEPARDAGLLQMPAAYVVMVEDEPKDPLSQTSYIQEIKDVFDVYVAVAATDELGASRADFLHDVRAELLLALAGWEPMKGYAGLVYEGGALELLNRARLVYRYSFSGEFSVGRNTAQGPGERLPAETWPEAAQDRLPELRELHINVDAIDPMADRNIKYPGPDGRIELQTHVELPNGEEN